MGTNTLGSKNDGDVASAEDVNQYRDALTPDVVPRNSSGIATDIASSLGTTVFRWLNGVFKVLKIGETASALSIEEDTGELIFKIGGVEKARIGSSGLDGAGIEDNTISGAAIATLSRASLNFQDFTYSRTFNVPDHVSDILIIACGGGGGASAGASSATNGGGGGGGAQVGIRMLAVTPGGTVSVTIGAGGLGSGVSSGRGSNGSTTSVGGLTFVGGIGGGRDESGNANNTYNQGGKSPAYGGDSEKPGLGSYISNGAVGGSPDGSWKGGGGGGSGPFGSGGAGRDGSSTGGDATGFDALNNTGGGGGGGGSSTGNSTGGDGGSGRVYIIYAEN